jgi:hypothetical protein
MSVEALGGDASPTVPFSWGHPWPDGAFHELEVDADLRRRRTWVAASRLRSVTRAVDHRDRARRWLVSFPAAR